MVRSSWRAQGLASAALLWPSVSSEASLTMRGAQPPSPDTRPPSAPGLALPGPGPRRAWSAATCWMLPGPSGWEWSVPLVLYAVPPPGWGWQAPSRAEPGS